MKIEKGQIVLITKLPCYDEHRYAYVDKIMMCEYGPRYIVQKEKTGHDGYFQIMLSPGEIRPVDVNMDNIYARYATLQAEILEWAIALFKSTPPKIANQIVLNKIESLKKKANSKAKVLLP